MIYHTYAQIMRHIGIIACSSVVIEYLTGSVSLSFLLLFILVMIYLKWLGVFKPANSNKIDISASIQKLRNADDKSETPLSSFEFIAKEYNAGFFLTMSVFALMIWLSTKLIIAWLTPLFTSQIFDSTDIIWAVLPIGGAILCYLVAKNEDKNKIPLVSISTLRLSPQKLQIIQFNQVLDIP